MINASAPGKIILFGEHVVVYNRPALAVPVLHVHADVEISASDHAGIWVMAPDIDVQDELSMLLPTDALRSVIESVFETLEIPPHSAGAFLAEKLGGADGVNIRITSTIPVASGLGSGAAVSTALIRALSDAVHHPLSTAQINKMVYEIEKLHHGTPSGIDNTVITYAQPVYFIRSQPIEAFHVGKPFTLVIGNTGVHAPTKESVGDVRDLWLADYDRWEAIFDQVAEIVQQARIAIETGDVAALGPLMNANHALLQTLTVSSPELDGLVEAAKTAGASGAKLSGGGRGGNMIALVEPQRADQVAEALRIAGAVSTIVTTIQ